MRGYSLLDNVVANVLPFFLLLMMMAAMFLVALFIGQLIGTWDIWNDNQVKTLFPCAEDAVLMHNGPGYSIGCVHIEELINRIQE